MLGKSMWKKSNLLSYKFSIYYRNSQSNMENLDMKQLPYTPTQKDMTETRIHHMLSENLFMPRARVRHCNDPQMLNSLIIYSYFQPRKMSYSRHAMKDEDLAMNHDVNYRVHMHVRRMMSENKAMRRRKQARKNQLNSANVSKGYDNRAFEENEAANAPKAKVSIQ